MGIVNGLLFGGYNDAILGKAAGLKKLEIIPCEYKEVSPSEKKLYILNDENIWVKAQYNPATVNVRFERQYISTEDDKESKANQKVAEQPKIVHATLDLIFDDAKFPSDGTSVLGPTVGGITSLFKPLNEVCKAYIRLQIYASSQLPIVIRWGTTFYGFGEDSGEELAGRITNLDTTFEMFDTEGTPKRIRCGLSFVGLPDAKVSEPLF